MIRRLPWILAGVAGAAALAVYALLPADTPEAAPPAASAVAALPLALPAVQPPASASAASQAGGNAAPEARPLATPLTAAARSVGSEGYGPHIDRAQAGADPRAVWDAVQWLRQCASNEVRRHSFERVRDQGVATEAMTQMMVEADAEARRCQTVTPQHQALLPELAARAMRAGVPEAASAYAGAVFPGDLTPAQRHDVAEAMRRDARAGDVPSLLGAVVANPAWGLDDTERLSYVYAYGLLGGQHAQAVAKSLLEQRQLPLSAKPTPQQLAAAEAAGREIFARAQRKP